MTAKEMHEKYYHLFETYNSEDSSYYKKGSILRGIETPETWDWIVERLLESIEWIRTNNTYIKNPDYNLDDKKSHAYIKGPDHNIKIFQIKEKFGNLECYYTYNGEKSHIRESIEYAIGEASGLARHTCAICGVLGDKGKPLTKVNKGWILYICTECFEKKENK